MPKQISSTGLEQGSKKKGACRERLLSQMEQTVPWKMLVKTLEPRHPKGHRGRPPVGIERMLRMYFVQQWFGLADEAAKDSLYDMPAFRCFVGIDLSREHLPDATTLLKFRRFLEKHDPRKDIYNAGLS